MEPPAAWNTGRLLSGPGCHICLCNGRRRLWQEVCQLGGGEGSDGPGMGSPGMVLGLLVQFWGEYLGLPPLRTHLLLSSPAACPPAQGPSKRKSLYRVRYGSSPAQTQNMIGAGGLRKDPLRAPRIQSKPCPTYQPGLTSLISTLRDAFAPSLLLQPGSFSFSVSPMGRLDMALKPLHLLFQLPNALLQISCLYPPLQLHLKCGELHITSPSPGL